MGHRIGFVATRFSGTDDVSLESAKWARVLEERGDSINWYAGMLDRDASGSMVVAEAYFRHATNEWFNKRVFRSSPRILLGAKSVFGEIGVGSARDGIPPDASVHSARHHQLHGTA